jgi:hypothetical protein
MKTLILITAAIVPFGFVILALAIFTHTAITRHRAQTARAVTVPAKR